MFRGRSPADLEAAHCSGRHYVGYDIDLGYVEYARARAQEPCSPRPDQLVATYEKIAIDAAHPAGKKRFPTRYRKGPR